MAGHKHDLAQLHLGVTAYAVLRQGHPRLPALKLSKDDGAASRALLERCFAAARRLLPESPGGRASIFSLNDAPVELDAAALVSLDQRLRDTTAALAESPWSDPLGPLFEASARTDHRRDRGQHFTPPAVVDLVLALGGSRDDAQVIDPTCGTGAFLLRAAATESAGHRRRTARLWGCELDERAAELARINMRRAGAKPRARIRCGDVFALLPGASVEDGVLPRCHAVVGNLPYVRRHRRADTARWERRLGRRWAKVDPSLVKRGPAGRPVLQLSGHADLYALLFFHLAELLEPGGRMALLTANAYLDAEYGQTLRRLLARHFRIVAVVESRCEPWFADASVNTAITVVERLVQGDDPAEHPARFVKLTDPVADADAAALAGAIESVTPRSARKTPRAQWLRSADRPSCRVRLVPQHRLVGDSDAPGEPWSPYLHAPEVYFALREHPGLRTVGEQVTLRRGVTTNWNPFFYPPADAGIEPQYLMPVVRSPRVSRSIGLNADALGDRLFVCDRAEAALRREGHRGALAWIARGKGMVNRQGRPIRESLGGARWWALAPQRYRLLLTKALHDTHLHRLVDRPVALDQRLYGVQTAREEDLELVAALLNSSFVALQAEVVGSTSLGDGALDLPVTTVRNRFLLPDLAALPNGMRRRLVSAFRKLVSRPVEPIRQEVKREDRRRLDRAVLETIGLDPEHTLPELYAGLCELTRERLTLAARRRALRRD